ncbi:MAG: rod shape-determining protein MreC [Lysobacterales bacterium]
MLPVNDKNLVSRESSSPGRWFGEEGSRTARLMIYILLAIVLMFMDQIGHYVPRIRTAMELAFEPVFHVAGWPAEAFESIELRTRERNKLITENQQLLEQLLKVSGSVQTQTALVQENQRLRDLLGATRGREYFFEFAEMTRVDLDPFSHKVWINRGADEGVLVGQAVIDGLGIVGQVEDVLRHLSSVRLISDPDHALPVQINRTGLRTVAYGRGETSHLLMPNVPLQADVSPGDVIVTSGLGDRFPPGFPVGEVERVERDSGETFAKVYVRPYAALDRGREVLLIEVQKPPEALPTETEDASEPPQLEPQDVAESLPVDQQ